MSDLEIKRYNFEPLDKVPKPVAPYAHASSCGGWFFITGQLAIDPSSNQMISGSIVEQTNQVMENLAAVLDKLDCKLQDVLMVRAYLADMSDYEAFNDTYKTWFSDKLPSRTCIGVNGLALGGLIEIDLTLFNSKMVTIDAEGRGNEY